MSEGGRLQGLAAQLRAALRGRVLEGHPLAPHTTYRLGGPAELAVLPADVAELATALALAAAAGVTPVVLGGGSNVLIADHGVSGLVLLTTELAAVAAVDGARLVAEAGAPSHAVAEAACAAGLCGAEFLSWLPESIGGACFMNARAFGGEVSQVLVAARVVDAAGVSRELALAPEQFAYKRSPFQGSGLIIAVATLALRAGDPAVITARMAHIERERRARHEPDHPSCGCVFQNDRAIGVSSGRLIEDCGLKGFRVGGAEVSPHHANFVINRGDATAADVRGVIEHVRRVVEERTGHRLALEVRLLGDWHQP